MPATAHNDEILVTALGAVSRSDWGRDPVEFIKAQGRLFSAMQPFFGFAATQAMTDDELTEAAAIRVAAILSNGDR